MESMSRFLFGLFSFVSDMCAHLFPLLLEKFHKKIINFGFLFDIDFSSIDFEVFLIVQYKIDGCVNKPTAKSFTFKQFYEPFKINIYIFFSK